MCNWKLPTGSRCFDEDKTSAVAVHDGICIQLVIRSSKHVSKKTPKSALDSIDKVSIRH